MTGVRPTPEEHPHFDPEDDRADYGDDDSTWSEADEVAFSFWSKVWPESIERTGRASEVSE